MATNTLSSCENPQFPNWMWRYNRNKCLSRFEPWYTRAERWPPHYRNMGVHDDFQFHPPEEMGKGQPFQRLGVNFAHDLIKNRQTGSGNGALGNPPGPAPPRLIIYNAQMPHSQDELYKVNEIHGISPGMSLLEHTVLPPIEDDSYRLPLDPRQYLQETVGQRLEFPGTFPYRNRPIPNTNMNVPRKCGKSEQARDPMQLWLHKYRSRELGYDAQQTSLLYTPPLYEHPCSSALTLRPDYEGMRPPEHTC